MVFDYMDHDLTGLLERRGYKLTLPQVCICPAHTFHGLQASYLFLTLGTKLQGLA